VKYAKEPKKIIKAEVAADKIMELRLRQAGRGQLAKTGESAYVDSVVSSSERASDKTEKGEQYLWGLKRECYRLFMPFCIFFLGLLSSTLPFHLCCWRFVSDSSGLSANHSLFETFPSNYYMF